MVGYCVVTYIVEHTPAKRTAFFKTPQIQPCSYEGPVISLCSSGDAGHIRQCSHPQADWDNCRRDWPPGPNEQRCSSCPLHSRHQIGSTRHLLYFVCPRPGGGIWEWNCEQMAARLSLFNGRKIIAIATGNGPFRPGVLRRKLDDPELVKAKFPGCEFLIVQNDGALGETVAWESLWEQVTHGQSDVTFYAHAKGVKWGVHHPHSPWIRLWCQMMYETCLDDWPAVQEQLKLYPLTGSVRKLGRCFPEDVQDSQWHYSGSFYWVRNADWYARGGHRARPTRMTSEALPGVLFKPGEAGHLLCSGMAPELHLYEEPSWTKTIFPAWRRWREARGLDASLLAH